MSAPVCNGYVRAALIAGVLLTACASPVVTPAAQGGCEPTIARMVPPQVVVDAMIGGMRPQPSHVPTREEYAATGNWIGNDALWISLPTDGRLLVRQESPTRAQHPAEPWGTKVWMIPLKSGQPLLTGRRLDGSGTFVGTASDGNIGSGVNFSQLGCWELEYEIAGDRVRFTVNVVGQP